MAPLSAPRVSVLSADLGPMARIELTWPVHFRAQATDDRRLLVLTFDKPFNAPDLGALRQRLGNWIAGIRKTSNRLELVAAQDVFFHVIQDRRQLTIEMTYASNFLPGLPGREVAPDSRVVLTPPAETPAAAPEVRQARAVPPPPPLRPVQAQDGEADLDDRARSAVHRLRRSSEARDAHSGSFVVSDVFMAEMRAVPEVVIEQNDVSAVISIDWAHPVDLRPETGGAEMLLRLGEALDPAIADGLVERMPGWLDGVSTGYDSLLLIGQPGVRFVADHQGSRTTVRLVREENGSAPRDRADVRLDILRARLAARRGETSEAKIKLVTLQNENPDNADILVEMASIEASLGSWRQASSLYDRAMGVDPQRRDAAAAQRALQREFGPQLRLDVDYQQVKDGDLQIISVLSGQFLPTDTIDAGFRLENRFLDDDVVLRANGVTRAETVNRQRIEVYAGGSPGTGQRIEGAILGSPAGPGAALRYNFRTPDSVTGVSAVWNRAYWDLVEGIVDDGSQDRLSLRHERRFTRRWSGDAEIALNRYGIAGIETAATTLDLTLAVNYLVPWEVADLTLGYGFDGQYVGALETRIDANGNAFNPLPLTDTEFHSLNVSLGDVFLQDWRYLVFLSVSADRLGDALGPSIGGELVWEPRDDVQLGLRAGHSRVSGRGDDAVFTRIGGHFLVRF